LHVCTIIAKNYVAHARVLARSLSETHPGSRLQTLVIDDYRTYIDPAEEPFDILTPQDIGCDEFVQMALRYTILELSTAVKPWLMRHLLDSTGAPVTYLDPDIRIFGSLGKLDELAARHGVVLTPHNSRPIPPDGRKPSQVDVMIAGIYNLGYVSMAPGKEVDGLIDWWADRLRRDCRVDPIWGYFVDQRWFDLAPGFLSDIAILRDPEYNLAYWNIHERQLEHGELGYTVDGRPLAFYHFSGFDPDHPLVLSRHQDRTDVVGHPVLKRLLAEYADAVLESGHRVSRHWPYEFAALGDGTRLDARLRILFDEYAELQAGDAPSAFTLAGARAFDAWLAEPAPGAPPGINRALAHIYEHRVDIRGAFPDLGGGDLPRFLEWADGPGAREEPLLVRVSAARVAIDPTAASAPTPADGASRSAAVAPTLELRGAPWGVNVVGDFQAQSALGEVARWLVEGLDTTGVRVLPTLGFDPPGGPELAYAARPAREAPFAVNIVCAGPNTLPALASHAGDALFRGRYTVGLWFWDGESFPAAWNERYSLVDEVWAPSAYSARALEQGATVPVHAVRIPVAPLRGPRRTRAELNLPAGRFLFHTRVDYGAGVAQQNPLAVIDAFAREFAPGEGAGLVIDCRGQRQAGIEHADVVRAADRHPDIELIDRDVAPGEILAVTELCDSYVSLHRATAFGVPLAQAMWFGKPVIATGYSGNLEFMTASNSHLVPYTLKPVGEGHAPFSPRSNWAEPDLVQAAALMRQVFEDRAAATALGAEAGEAIRRSHSPRAARDQLHERLESIRATGRVRRPTDPVLDHPRILTRLPLKLQSGPPEVKPGRARGAREQLKQTILRVMRPYTSWQHGINAEFIAALGELSRDIAQTRQEAVIDWATVLAGGRQQSAALTHGDQTSEDVGEIKRILTLETDRSIYLALAELSRRHARIGPRTGEPATDASLSGYELRAYSQNGEDGVLAEVLRRIGVTERYFVEFGVESGQEGNCVYLADVADWHGLFMEAGDEMFESLERKYAARPGVATIRARVMAENVERLFAQAGVPPEPDVLSIDIDGQDYWIWEAVEQYRPRVVVIEYNSALDPVRKLVEPHDPGEGWDGSADYGASLGAVRALGERKGYRFVHAELSAVNAFFVREDLAGEAGFPEPDAVAIRGRPNFYQRGTSHPSTGSPARYVDLDTGRLVDGSRAQ
jgi:glycosyltransferase involved in cell wall biosynthesis